MQSLHRYLFFIVTVAILFGSYLIFPYSMKLEPLRFITHRIYIQEIYWVLGAVILLFPIHLLGKDTNFQKITNRVLDAFYAIPSRIFDAILAVFLFVVSLGSAYIFFGALPNISDEVAYLTQAKIFAGGHLTVPAPYGPAVYYAQLVEDNDRLFSMFPPGHSLVLALGVFFGRPEMAAPLLGAFSLLLWMRWLRLFYEETTARLAGLFFVLSPTVILISATYLSHSSCLFWFLLYLYSLSQAVIKNENPWKSVWKEYALAGLSAGMLIITRQLDGLVLILGGGFFGWFVPVWRQFKSQQDSPVRWIPQLAWSVLIFFMAFVIPVLFHLYYNHVAFGDAWVSGYQKYYGAFPYGFGPNIVGSNHTWLKGLLYVWTYTNLLGVQSVFWPVHTLSLVLLVVVAGCWKKFFPTTFAIHRWDVYSLCLVFLYILAYLPYPIPNTILGARFYYPVIPFWILLALRGAQLLLQPATPVLRSTCQSIFLWIGCVFYLYGFLIHGPILYPFLQSHRYAECYYDPKYNILETMAEFHVEKALIMMTVPPSRHLVGAAGFRYNDPYYDSSYQFIYNQGPISNLHHIVTHPHEVPFFINLFDLSHPVIQPVSIEPSLHVRSYYHKQKKSAAQPIPSADQDFIQWEVVLPPLPPGIKIHGVEVHALDKDSGQLLNEQWSTLDPMLKPLELTNAQGQPLTLNVEQYHKDPNQGFAFPPGVPSRLLLKGKKIDPDREETTAAYRVWVVLNNNTFLFGGTSPHHPLNWVMVCDDFNSYRELTGTVDRDRRDDVGLTIRWNFVQKDIDFFHVYVQVDDQSPIFLASTENGTKQHYDWHANAPLLNPLFKKGPKPGHDYQFQVFPIKKDGSGFYPPIATHQPTRVEFTFLNLVYLLVGVAFGTVVVTSLFVNHKKNVST